MTHYLLAAWHTADEAMPPPEVMNEMFAAVDLFNQEVITAGALVFGGGLQPPAAATVVGAHFDAEPTAVGPLSPADEQISGFWIIGAPDLDAALSGAGKGSAACRGAVEVRPFQDER